jgi:hypothetical protein
MMMKIAAIIVRDSGSRMSMKNLIGPAPSIRAASSNSSGMDMKNCRKKKVAGRRRDQRHDQTRIAVQQPSFACHDLVGRQDAHFQRQQQRGEDHPEESSAKGKRK